MQSISYTNTVAVSVTLHGAVGVVGVSPAVNITGLSGFGGPPTNVFTRRAPYQRGTSFLAARMGPRSFTLQDEILADTAAQLAAYLATLVDVLNPEWGLGTLTVVRDDSVSRALDCLCTEGLELAHSAEQDGPLVQRIPLVFTAPDPRWYDPAAVTVSFSGTGGGLTLPFSLPTTLMVSGTAIGVPSSIVYAGTSPTEPVITLQGPMVNPVLLNVTTGKALTFSYSLPVNSSLAVDMRFGQKTATLTAFGSTFDLLPYLSDDSEFWTLEPGTNVVLLTNDSPRPGGAASLVYTTRYSGL